VDTPRLQAAATGQISGNIYLPSSNSGINQVFDSLYTKGTATIYPDLFFVDLQSAISQSTTLPGFGFQNFSTLPRNQQTLRYLSNVSPYVRKSFDGSVDTALRYTFGSTNYGSYTTIVTALVIPGQANLASSTLNEGTLIAATGDNFQRMLARFTADAFDYNSSSSVLRNTQVSGYNDLEYRFTPRIAALARAGYQNVRYPSSPAATFAGT
jgi:uncharacterized protein (PEP-CTERM system associated)